MNRYRRLRLTKTIRSLVAETQLTANDLIQPFFAIEGENKKEPIDAMPGIDRLSVDLLLKEIEGYFKAGGKAGLLFGIPSKKDSKGSEAYLAHGIVQKALREIKKAFPEFLVITDVCLCQYTDHGHCGIIEGNDVDNDATIAALGKVAVSHASAGADIVAPSDMMDFRVRRIREDLDKDGFINTAIMSYAVKYSSAFYGPFRDAAHCAPQFGNRQTYQMDAANKREALKEAKQDVAEGADMIIVKPALAYLDVIALLRRKLEHPIVAYSVSGEYAMIKAAAQKKWIDEQSVALESLLAITQAIASLYF